MSCIISLFIAGTPYEGGFFKMKLVLGKEFPSVPPQGFFLTKIFHPNVAKNGAICVNTLKKDWKPDHGIKHILLVRQRVKNNNNSCDTRQEHNTVEPPIVDPPNKGHNRNNLSIKDGYLDDSNSNAHNNYDNYGLKGYYLHRNC